MGTLDRAPLAPRFVTQAWFAWAKSRLVREHD